MLYTTESYFHHQSLFDWSDGNLLPTGVRLQETIDLSIVKELLAKNMAGSGFDVEFSFDQVQSGGMFNKQVDDCLIMKNSEHKDDYFNFVFTVHNVSKYSTVSFFRSGSSTNHFQNNKRARRKESGSFLGSVAGALTKVNEHALADEELYYSIAADVIRKTFGI